MDSTRTIGPGTGTAVITALRRRVPPAVRARLRHDVLDPIARARRRAANRYRQVRGMPLTRTGPFSGLYGTDRGAAVDRVFIDGYLARHSADVHGDVLEVQEDRYASRLGDGRTRSVTILDVRATNPQATLVADLCQRGSLPSGAFDCAIVTQTLQYLPDVASALTNLWGALRPGGVILLTAPSLSRLDPYDVDLWRWTPTGLTRQLRESLPPDAEVEVEGHGNAIAGAAFFAGLAAEDVGVERVGVDDPSFPVTVCARVVRPAGAAHGAP